MEFSHLLNRGVDKRDIFLDKQDYHRFIYNLSIFNDAQDLDPNHNKRSDKESLESNFGINKQPLVHIHFFCLMPNHYHLMVSPVTEDGISRFMKKLNMGYARYFNEKNDRTGALFQGKYKSILIEKDAHFLYLPYYIHFNPLDLKIPEWREHKIRNPKKALEYLYSYRWSSHRDYMGIKNFPCATQRKFFLELFGGEKKYIQSIEESLANMNIDDLGNTILE